MKKLLKSSFAVGLTAAVFALFILVASPAYAAGGLTISTPFPGTTVSAGKTATFNLTLDNAGLTPLNTEVKVSDLPAGWSAQLVGGANEISRAFVRAEGTVTFTLNIDIPAGTKEGVYKVSVTADAGDGIADTLDLALAVSETDISQGLFQTQFPELQGGATTTFTFKADLTNSSADDRYYSLVANPPDGWQVGFRPEGASSDIASLSIAAGQTQSITVTVKPPTDVKAGEYMIPCIAVSATDTMALDLKVIITGNYELQIITKDGRLNAETQAGKESPITLIIANSGSADLTSISLESTLPTTGWAVRFDQATIDVLPAGATQEVVAYIQPDINAVTGDYSATISASTAQANAGLVLRVAVETSTLWGVVAIIIIALLACGLYFVFKKFGRR